VPPVSGGRLADGSISINAIYARRGSTFVGLDDESNGKVPSDAAMKSAALLMLGNLS
jgi:hypothetical protein